MANIGDILATPESGYQRVSPLNINYILDNMAVKVDGDSIEALDSSSTFTSKIKFYAYTSKLILLTWDSIYFSKNIMIKIDGVEYRWNSNINATTVNSALLPRPKSVAFIKEDLAKSIHCIELYMDSETILRSYDSAGYNFSFSGIDIDDDGYMCYQDEKGRLYYDVTPIMTSNTTPSPYVVSSSGVRQNTPQYQPFKAFNGGIGFKIDGYVDSYVSDKDKSWLTFDFGKSIIVTDFILGKNNLISSLSLPSIFNMYGSNNGINYELIKEYSNSKLWDSDEIRIYSFDNSKKYRYYKMDIINNFGEPTYSAIQELRYLLSVDTPFYLIQDNVDNKIYNYDEENNTLIEVTDISILNVDTLNNICIYDLSKATPLLDTLSDDLTILCNNNNKKIIVKGIKSNKELFIGKNSFSTKLANNIDYFKLDENATAKVIFSIDDGATWKTYNTSTNTFEDLSISIPVNKDYSDFTDEEITAWEDAKEIVYSQGIDSSILNTIDFNTLKAEKIRFGYVLSAINTETMDRMTNLIWKFDSKGVMELVDGDKVKQQLFYGGVKLISNIDADMLKVNVTYEGIGGELPH